MVPDEPERVRYSSGRGANKPGGPGQPGGDRGRLVRSAVAQVRLSHVIDSWSTVAIETHTR
jgi:hypothetical protein